MCMSALFKKNKTGSIAYTVPVKFKQKCREAAPVNMHMNLKINTELIANVMNKYKQTCEVIPYKCVQINRKMSHK